MHKMQAIILGSALGALVMSASAVSAQGAQGEMFRRHFWRGQAYHGPGYPAQVGEMKGGTPPRGAPVGAATLQATVEDGTKGAAIARDAAACAARFKTYDASSGTYVGRGGRRLVCP